LPEEFLELCASDSVAPTIVLLLRGFIADLCQTMSWAADPRNEGFCSNGRDERSMPVAYFQRRGYPR
jgi:hypothetical protein